MSQIKLFVLNLLVSVTAVTFVFVTSEVVLSVSGKIRTYKILEGDSLLVICKATNSSDTEIYWTKNDTQSTFFQQGKRLEIINIKRSDSGEYICHALNTSVPAYNESDVNVTVEVINVDVQYPAEIDDFVIEPHELMENATFNVTCDFQANPDPIWSIRNRNTGLQLLSGTVSAKSSIYHKVGCDDTGYWECTGYNILSNGVNITMGQNITVYCSPRPQYEKNQYIVQSVVGQNVTLAMHLLAYPVANYTWMKDDGTDISNASKQENFERETLLTFPSMSIPDFGNYTLKMQNEYGTYYASYQLVADGPPETPTNLHFSDVTYNSVKLQWTSGFDMGSRQHFIVMKLHGNVFVQVSDLIYDNSTNHGVNQDWTYNLTNLASDTFYNLTVVSENERGFWSAFSKPSVSFTTKKYPKIKESSKTDVKLIVGLALGTIATVAVFAFMVYVVKSRRLRASYKAMNE